MKIQVVVLSLTVTAVNQKDGRSMLGSMKTIFTTFSLPRPLASLNYSGLLDTQQFYIESNHRKPSHNYA